MRPERGISAKSFAGWASKRVGRLCGMAALLVLVLLAGEGLRRACAQQGSASLPAIDPPKTAAAPPAPKAGAAGRQQSANDEQPGAADQQPASFSLPAIDPPSMALRPAVAGEQAKQDSADQQQPATPDPNEPEAVRECADLLKMATSLKQAVDKTNQDMLSVTVVRKADQIEQFARKVRLGSGKS